MDSGSRGPTLKGAIREYIQSEVIDDVLQFTDLKEWKMTLNDLLQNSRTRDIPHVCYCVVECFGAKLFKPEEFEHIVLKYLALMLDDSAGDCPNIYQTVGQLLAQLLWHRCLQPTILATFFKYYKEYSEKQKGAKNKCAQRIFDGVLAEMRHNNADSKFMKIVERNGPDSSSNKHKGKGRRF